MSVFSEEDMCMVLCWILLQTVGNTADTSHISQWQQTNVGWFLSNDGGLRGRDMDLGRTREKVTNPSDVHGS